MISFSKILLKWIIHGQHFLVQRKNVSVHRNVLTTLSVQHKNVSVHCSPTGFKLNVCVRAWSYIDTWIKIPRQPEGVREHRKDWCVLFLHEILVYASGTLEKGRQTLFWHTCSQIWDIGAEVARMAY